jgi:hypothetical protein
VLAARNEAALAALVEEIEAWLEAQ